MRIHSMPCAPRGRTALLLLSSVSLLAVTSQALAQSTSNTQLPPVDIEQSKAKAAAKKKAAKTQAQPPASAPAPEPAALADTSTPDDETRATALGTYNPALDLEGVKLPPGTTITTAGPVQGYRALSAMSSTKTATPIEQIPQSIQVVPRKVLDDQRAISVEEAVKNVSSVQGTNRLQTPAYDSTKIRGFAAEQWLDGLTVYYNVGDRDALANVERVEVLKGPSAILYGGGAGAPIGGAVNVISKLPTNVASGAFGVTVGSFGFVNPFFDVNQPIAKDGTVLFRMTGEYTAADSFIDVLETDRYSLNPTLTLTNKSDTTLTLQGHFSKWEQQEYQGLPATGTVAGAFRIDPELFIGPADVPKSSSETQGITVTFDHKISSILSASVKGRWSNSEFAELAQSIGGAPLGFLGPNFTANDPVAAPSTWALSNIYLTQETAEFTINPTLTAKFETGPSRNVVVVGSDYSRLTDKGILTFDYLLDPTRTIDLANPAGPFPPYSQPGDSSLTTIQKPDNRYQTQGAYAQVQSSFYETVHLMAGVRVSNIKIDYVDPVGGANFKTDKTKVLPRVGAVVDVLPGGSVFASYSQGMKANPYTFFAGQPEPEESEQREVGLKFDTTVGLSGTISVFEIDRSKVPVPSAPGSFFSVAAGEQRSRGFETDVIWQPNSNWQILANYSLVDAELVRATFTLPAGSPLVGVPEQSGRLWVNYIFEPDVFRGLSVGAGIYAASGAPVELGRTFMTDAYFTVDAKVAYDAKTWSAALNVKNLTGEEYFVPYSYFNGRVAPGDERSVFGTVTYKY